MNATNTKTHAPDETPRDPGRAARTALSLAVLALSLALLALYHARNWALVRDAVRHVARTALSMPGDRKGAEEPGSPMIPPEHP